MIEIYPTLQIDTVEKLRKEYLNRGLDGQDSLSCHMLMAVSSEPVGASRFYRNQDDIVIDCLTLKSSLNFEFKQMLLRATINHAMNFTNNCIYINENEQEILQEMGFECKHNFFVANVKDIVFPCKCKK